ncbi:formin-binding protein 4 isoform X2 [Solenopsis invicta]|uniref:formin-binding protein 4 isoform X2 n=1 Tax=Solenopsis invicta TaxID=13686 RepID=UPI00193DD975|nr:formin-binding protein 4 isoform X2 [Solenopsis invicta]
MKRRQRRPVLTLNKPQGSHHGERAQSRCKSINNVQSTQSEANNPLANMLCQYNSDSDTEDSKKDTQKLDDQVNDFLKEIQLIAPEQPVPNVAPDSSLTAKAVPRSVHHTNQQTMWQECYDESTGYPYYWHIETNEVTWDMPEELRLLQKQSETGTGTKYPTQGPHWVDFSSIAYRQSQANIPEGMIPQEVVARNRNRFLHNETPKKHNSESKQEIKNESPAKDDDSDDGRIEMITSFGSDGSDSEDENNSSDENKIPVPVSESGKSNPTPYAKSSEIGPAFCPTGIQSPTKNLFHSYKSESTNISNSTNHPEQLDECKITESDSKNSVVQSEKEFLMGNKNRKDINALNTISKLDLNVSLVPGYGDDSDGEEEVRPKQEIKPLFPIAQSEEFISVTNSLKNAHDSSAKNTGTVQASDQCNDSNEDTQEMKNDQEKTEKESKTDEDKSKTNIFLEDMQVCGKAFQRKKRIAFDVTSTKVKQNNNTNLENTTRDDNSSDLVSSETSRKDVEDDDAEVNNQLGAESQNECDESHKEIEQCVNIKTEEKLSTKNESCDSEISAEHKIESSVVEEKANEEMNDLSQIITEKLKFLSEGRESVSAVQTMQIQLQTLSTAWTAGSLEDSYFQKWLTNTNHELERLEQDAAPAGWLCQWDRSHKRYYYHNTSTGTLQWTYPDTGIAGGTEEMELCTTPPPESEELLITESSKKTKEKQAEEMDDNKAEDENLSADKRSASLEAPPPPQISNPSPPPPPRIFAEDLKKDKKKREKSDEKFLDAKRKRLGKGNELLDRIMTLDTQIVNPALESLSYAHPQVAVSSQTSIPPNHANMEPLPPGVDLPDTSYEAATLKGIIYNAATQPSSAIYASSIADPTIPILSHQAGLLQEPFVHYPTFHQHLHNTIAVANKHSGQSAIQFMVGYAPIYTNNKIIAKPPVKASKESLGSALDSFYNDIARIEKTETERSGQHQDVAATVTEQVSTPTEEAKPEIEPEIAPNDASKERKKKKARISNSKKHKEMSSMVAKWQRVQKNLEDTV